MMTTIEGRRYWERGDPHHVWVVQTVTAPPGGGQRYAVLVSETDDSEREVELSRLLDSNCYTPVPQDPHHIDTSTAS